MGDEKDLLATLQEALNCCDQQHQREIEAFDRFDERLKSHDEAVLAEFRLAMKRSNQRRALIAQEIAEAAFQIVGVPRQGVPPPLRETSRIFDNSADRAGYDYTDDPLMLVGERSE
jgi:hypothetical protein